MPLKLVTGPANSGRAGVVLGAYRERLAERPILVVPAFRDVEHVLRELAAGGAVLGAEVVRFVWLFDTIAERCGDGAARRRPASDLQRELLMEAAVRDLELEELAESAGRPGFVRAALRLAAELERSMVAPERLEAALADWAGGGPRGRHAREVAAIYAAYRERLEAAGLVDEDLRAWRAVDALRERPERWGSTAVLAYGFDDFTPIELDAIETLAGPAGAEVVVSLPYERGRAAFTAVAPVLERLAALADEHVGLPAVSDHYAPESRAALHHLERRLYETPDGRAEPAGAVRLLAAGGERAEVELVAAEVLREVRGGTAAGDVAVVFRRPERYASLVEQVFGAYGLPYAIDRWVPLAHTALGRGLLALLRAAGRDGTADDLLSYLRTPGLLERPRIADRLEAEARREGARTAAAARRLWEGRRWPLGELDRLARVAGADLVDRVEAELGRLFAAGYGRTAPIFGRGELEDPRVFEAARAALRELRDLAGAGVELDLARVHDALGRISVRLGEPPAPDRVQVASPEAVRARRFEAVFVCGLQEGEFPRPAPREPFLSDDERRAIAEATGLSLPVAGDELERERHLFYVCASRAERLLCLSWRFADEEGRPQVRSFLVDEAVDLFEPGLAESATVRTLADVAWPSDLAPTDAEWERALALAGPEEEQPRPDGLRAREVLDDLAARTAFSAGALESFADCPVKWLVDQVLRPDPLEPDPEPMVRGSYAHAVLEATYRRLGEATGSAAVTEASLPEAERIVREELREQQSRFRISPKETRVRTAVRKLEFDLLRHLRREAESGGDFEPRELELEFGMPEGDGPRALELEGVAVRGRIDRVDVWDGHALVRDYKSGKKAYPVARWEEDNRLQVAVYMLAVRELLGLEPAGGVYVPLADRRGSPRGLLRADLADRLGEGFVRSDLKDPAEVDAQLSRARERVCEIAGRIRGGEVRPCPDSCAWNGGCSYPSICRVEER